ncbi:hypothetical protein KIL84_019783 [Mauremys mutica]|uniref:Uncharacterized protein n=1 Tax=Mauremys mutica TaxID=74926 RepID=A0A9D4BBK3_9SAUR|nr:hypothetical protein KIL84_019783 [Mauremys mutica]
MEVLCSLLEPQPLLWCPHAEPCLSHWVLSCHTHSRQHPAPGPVQGHVPMGAFDPAPGGGERLSTGCQSRDVKYSQLLSMETELEPREDGRAGCQLGQAEPPTPGSSPSTALPLGKGPG